VGLALSFVVAEIADGSSTASMARVSSLPKGHPAGYEGRLHEWMAARYGTKRSDGGAA